MWSGFRPEANPLLALLNDSGYQQLNIVRDPRARVDLEIGSVYPTRRFIMSALAKNIRNRVVRTPQDVRDSFRGEHKSETATRGIWYTPENRRPPDEGWDAYLSFETEGWPNNAYLPFWQLNSDLFGGGDSGFLGRKLLIHELTQPRVSDTPTRSKFCAAVIRNPDPVRLKAIELLREIGSVDIYGPLGGQPIPDKMSVLSQYRFALCFENDLYPGYVTEKPFDAWMAGCIPIYWGLDVTQQIAPDSLINVAHLAGLVGMVERVSEVDLDHTLINEIAAKNILQTKPTSDSVRRLVTSVMEG